jgi:hypothetical protein
MLANNPPARFQRLLQLSKQSHTPKEETEKQLEALRKDEIETAQKSRRSNEV